MLLCLPAPVVVVERPLSVEVPAASPLVPPVVVFVAEDLSAPVDDFSVVLLVLSLPVADAPPPEVSSRVGLVVDFSRSAPAAGEALLSAPPAPVLLRVALVSLAAGEDALAAVGDAAAAVPVEVFCRFDVVVPGEGDAVAALVRSSVPAVGDVAARVVVADARPGTGLAPVSTLVVVEFVPAAGAPTFTLVVLVEGAAVPPLLKNVSLRCITVGSSVSICVRSMVGAVTSRSRVMSMVATLAFSPTCTTLHGTG